MTLEDKAKLGYNVTQEDIDEYEAQQEEDGND
jgi:hypothetical protein